MRSTTTLIALTVALAACGPVTWQVAPTDPAVTPVVAGGKDDQKDTAPNRPDREDAFEREDDRDDRENRPDRDDAFERDNDQTDNDDRDDENRPDRDDPFEHDEDARDRDEDEDEDGGVNRPGREPKDEDTNEPEAQNPPTGRPNIHPPRPNDPPSPPADTGDVAGRPRPPRPDRPGQPNTPPDRERPDRPGQPETPGNQPDGDPVDPIEDLGSVRDIHIPPGHMPRDGLCRIWIDGTPPGRQARPVTCASLHGNVPDGAFVLFDDRVWDTHYDWVRHEARTPGSVPAPIVALMRSL